jgi:hypothetical protein
MAGTLLERELTAPQTDRLSFSIATEADDAEIRRLLRETPMRSRISLSFEREPSFFADPNFPSETRQTIVARNCGRLVCVGSCAIRPRFVNGKPRMVGYLGGLRLDAGSAGRFGILRRGYNLFRQLQQEAPADFYFTSVAADNERARAFLERGLPGMPRYEFICEFVTLTISTLGCKQSRQLTPNIPCTDSPNELLRLLNEHNRAYQFAPQWSAEDLCSRRRDEADADTGMESRLQPASRPNFSDVCVVRTGQQLEACGALWDQRHFKQVVVRGYSPLLARVRPTLNFISKLARQPRLPAIGETLSIAFASHLAAKNDAALTTLIQHIGNSALQCGIELLTLGFASNDPRLAIARNHFRCREYRSRLYVVNWPGIGGTARELDNRVLAPDVALL